MSKLFVSYSHKDVEWLDVLLKMAKPMKKYLEIKLWSDKDIKPSDDWSKEIEKALNETTVAVLLVSGNFLASDFILENELPYLLKAHESGKLKLLWILLSPCQYKLTGLRKIQAVSDPSTPLSSVGTFQRESAFLKICEEIDDILKSRETPVINTSLAGRLMKREERNLQVLANPAIRETDVLVYSRDKWYKQAKVKKGANVTDCFFGNEHTKAGEPFKIIAITAPYDEPLTSTSGYLNVPDYRTKSAEVTVKLG